MPLRPRTATLADIASVVPLLDAAYGPNPTFEPRFTSYLSLEPGGWVVVEGASGLMGVGGFVSFGRCAYVGLMAVSPDAQRRGIGAAIFEELLARCEVLGRTLLLLDASNAGAPLYERYSFRDHGTALAYTFDPRALASAPDDEGAIQVHAIDPADGPLAADVAAFDARCYGADRSLLVLRCLRDLPGRAFVARAASGELVGYAIGQARSFGPCMARSRDVAHALARRTLRLPYNDPVTWLVAGQNPDALALVRALGGTLGRTWRHMRRGNDAELTSDWSSLFAKVSLAVG
jgi:GNAT superfamily N-acetyltransferase